MGYPGTNLLGRLSRTRTRIASTGMPSNCTACFGGHRMEMIYTGETPRGCPACGRVGRLIVIDPVIGPDGRPVPERAEDLL